MKEEDYLKLCNYCDQILLSPDAGLETFAISWLHIIREHPVFLKNYEDVFFINGKLKIYINTFQRDLRNRIGLFRNMIKSIFSDGRPWYGSDAIPDNIDVLFISHLLSGNHAGTNDDFYYGCLPEELSKRGFSVAIAMINHSGESGKALSKRWSSSLISRFVFSSYLMFFEELSLYIRLDKESRRLKEQLKTKNSELGHIILKRASQEALSGSAHYNLRIADQIFRLASITRPKVIITTFEGHAWERLAFASARRAFPAVKCIGYQHAAVFRLQHAIRRNLKPEFNQDVILTAGSVGKAQLEGSKGLGEIPIFVLGSNRNLKKEIIDLINKKRIQSGKHQKKQICLVLPEGIIDECVIMFSFSLECALICPEVTFVWRLHPILSFVMLQKKIPSLKKLPSNIILSDNSFNEDIKVSRWALYRGSTAIVQAVSAGLRPIYLQIPNEMTIDPLYQLSEWRTFVSEPLEFRQFIENDMKRMQSQQVSSQKTALEFCESFFTPLDITTLEKYLDQNSSR